MDQTKTAEAEEAVRSITPPGGLVSPIMSVDDAQKLQNAFLKSAEATLEIASQVRDMIGAVTDAQGEHMIARADNRQTRRTIVTSHIIVIALLCTFLWLARSDANRTYAQAEITRDQLVATLKAVSASSVAQAAGIEATQSLKAVVGVIAKDAADDNAKASAVEAQAAAVSAQATLAPEPEKPAVRKIAAALAAKARAIRSEVQAPPPTVISPDASR